MSKKRFNAEQIVVVLRQIEVLMLQGKATAIACFCGLAEPLSARPRRYEEQVCQHAAICGQVVLSPAI